jgi:hypothetical protein
MSVQVQVVLLQVVVLLQAVVVLLQVVMDLLQVVMDLLQVVMDLLQVVVVLQVLLKSVNLMGMHNCVHIETRFNQIPAVLLRQMFKLNQNKYKNYIKAQARFLLLSKFLVILPSSLIEKLVPSLILKMEKNSIKIQMINGKLLLHKLMLFNQLYHSM